MNKKITPIASIVFVLSFFLIYLSVQYYRFLSTPLSKEQPVQYFFEPGSSVHRLVADFKAKGFMAHPHFFLLLAYSKGATNKLRSGEYLFPPGTRPGQLLDHMIAGDVILYRFTIVEGWTFQQLMTALATQLHVKHPHDLNLITSEVLSSLGLPKNPEGLFFPATYYFSLRTKERDLLKWSHQLLEKKLKQAWVTRDPDLPYKTAYEALIAASLVEKETALPEERALISGVIVRRLKKGMPLQIDASVIYGLGPFYSGKLSSEDLRKNTPYNSYLQRGLPPTPIALPSFASIEAVLHPDRSQSLYFVAKGDGSHQFSQNLSEHNRAVQRYQLDQNSLPLYKKNVPCSRWYLSKTMKSLLGCLNNVSVSSDE